MANRTQKDAQSIKGTNPQYLVEKIIRTRIYDSKYWKEECFGLSSELLVDKAMELESVGGVYGANVQPTDFLCLVLKMLQIQPSKDIVIEFIKNPDYKYVRVLGALYLRLVGTSLEVYNYLEPLYNDYRKLKVMDRNGNLHLSHVDEFVDLLLHQDRCCDIILPRIQKRHILEQSEQLEPRVSALDEDLEADEEEEEEEEEEESPPHHRRRSPSPYRDRGRHSRSPHHRSRSRSPMHRRRSYSRSPRRHRHRSPSPRRHTRRHSRSPSPYHRERGGGRGRERDRGREREYDRERERDWEREKEREERSKERERDRREKERERGEKKSSKEEGKSGKEKKKKKKRDKDGSKKESKEDEEIREQNELRAKLGLKPLRVD